MPRSRCLKIHRFMHYWDAVGRLSKWMSRRRIVRRPIGTDLPHRMPFQADRNQLAPQMTTWVKSVDFGASV
jgi:hypothetical protein